MFHNNHKVNFQTLLITMVTYPGKHNWLMEVPWKILRTKAQSRSEHIQDFCGQPASLPFLQWNYSGTLMCTRKQDSCSVSNISIAFAFKIHHEKQHRSSDIHQAIIWLRITTIVGSKPSSTDLSSLVTVPSNIKASSVAFLPNIYMDNIVNLSWQSQKVIFICNTDKQVLGHIVLTPVTFISTSSYFNSFFLQIKIYSQNNQNNTHYSNNQNNTHYSKWAFILA